MTGLTLHQHIGEKIHFDDLHSSSFAGLTAPPLDIEAKAPWFVASNHCLRGMSEEISYLAKDSCISSRIGARNTPYRRLIYINHLINMLQSQNLLIGHGLLERMIEMCVENRVESFIDQGRLPRT